MNRKGLERKPIKNFWKIGMVVAIMIAFILPGSAMFTDGVIFPNGTLAIGWDITLNFNEDSGNHDYVVFGEAPDACDGHNGGPAGNDEYDIQKPPAPPMPPYIRAWFNDGLDSPFNCLHADYRQYPDTSKVWNLSVQWVPEDMSSPTNITISWNTTEIDDSEYNSVVLYDVSDAIVVADMLVDTEYTFTATAMTPKDFKIRASGGAENNPPDTPSNPNPNNGATGVDINADLSWTGGDPDNDIVLYDVYFGKSSIPLKIISNQSATTYDPSTLDYETKYYWQIVAWDNHGDSTSSPIWSFTTKKSSNGDPGPGPGPGPEPNDPPTADANGPYTGFVGVPVVFDGSESTDPDGDITNYTWHFGDGTEGYGEITDHTYAEAGNYTVTLLVTDNGGIKRSDLTYTVITGVANNPPSIPVIAGSRMGQKNIIYNYTAMSTDPDNDTIRYFFDWDDGNNTTSDFLASGILYNVSHDWINSGIYTITVYAEDINHAVSGMVEMTIFIDVQFIDDDVIQGCLLDNDNDGIYDAFHNNATGSETTVELQDNGNYLIDSDGDAIWNYEYDPQTGTLASYPSEEEQTDEKEETPWYLLIIVAILVIILMIVYGAKKLKERQELKKEVRREMREEAEREAKKKEAEEQEAKSKEEDAEKEGKEDESTEKESGEDKP